MDNATLTAAIHDLHAAINALTNELRALQLTRQADIEALIALYQRPKAIGAEAESQE